MAGAAGEAGVEGVAGLVGVVFSDDRVYVTPTAPASLSLNATCDLGSLIVVTEAELEIRT